MNRLSLIVLSGVALAAPLAGCEQPATHCFAALSTYSPFTARLDKVSGADCPDHPRAMFIGVETYVRNPNHRGDDKNSVALQAQEAGEWTAIARDAEPSVVDANPDHKLYALGKFKTKYPNGDDVCTVPTLSVARVTLPEIPEYEVDDGDDADMLPDVVSQPAVSATYEWSNLRVYVTAADTGTQFGARLKYTKNGCSATYDVVAVNAAVACGTEDGKPDDSACEGAASANFGPLTCDPTLLHCVLEGDFPSLN